MKALRSVKTTSLSFGRFMVLGLVASASLGACASDDATDGDAGDGDAVSNELPTDTSQAGIEAFLDSGVYRMAPWTGDTAPRISDAGTNIHGDPEVTQEMQVFYNSAALATKMRSDGDTEADLGSMIVKEMYQDGTLGGYAAYVKTSEGRGMNTWTFYCAVSAEFSELCAGGTNEAPLYGEGLTECGYCHGEVPNSPLPQ